MRIKKKYKASYTVEATLVLPIVIFSLFYGMHQGIQMMTELREDSVYAEELKDYRAVKDFYRETLIQQEREETNAD